MKNTYEKFNIQIGKKIMKKRLQRGYTREYLAEMADISAKFLYEIEIGKKGCSVYVLYKIAHSLNEKIGCFVEDKIDDNRCEIYREFDDYQKKKINLILQILYDMMQNN